MAFYNAGESYEIVYGQREYTLVCVYTWEIQMTEALVTLFTHNPAVQKTRFEMALLQNEDDPQGWAAFVGVVEPDGRRTYRGFATMQEAVQHSSQILSYKVPDIL